jgi:ABC-2 type transport system permease protein
MSHCAGPDRRVVPLRRFRPRPGRGRAPEGRGPPRAGHSVGLVILFPLAIVSNGLVPTQRMPAVLRFIADWNPVSAVTAAARHLFGNPNPSAAIHAWPMQHPVAASLLWSVALLAIFAPLATLLYRRRTSG